MKRKLALSLVLFILISLVLTACDSSGGDDAVDVKSTADTSDASASGESETLRIEPNLPDKKYEGYEFTFLDKEFDGNGYWGAREIYAEKENADPINDAVYARNRTIEEKYGVNIKEVRTNDIVNMFAKSWRAGDDIYDCVMPQSQEAAKMATQGMLLSYDRLPYVDLSQPWWDKKVNDMITIGGDLFFTVGELNIVDNDATHVIMFNKTVARNAAVENMYQLVRDDKWTMDKMHAIMRDVSRDINGDSKMDENDLAGLLSDTGVLLAMYYNTGETVVKKDKDDLPYIALNSERGQAVLTKVTEMFSDKTSAVLANDLKGIANPWTDGLNKMFKEDRGLFYAIGLTVMHKMRDMNSDFGLLPFPKFDETQKEYYHNIHPWCTNVIAIPSIAGDTERTSIILEAMAAESLYTLTPAYYDITITNKTIRDEESAEMLDLIMSTRTLDLGFVFNWNNIGILPQTIYPKSDTFVSSFERIIDKANIEMQKTIDEFKSIKEAK